jgi:hypothetical protein
MDVRISGAEQFHQLAKTFRELDKQGLGRQMSRALGKTVAPIGKAIDKEAGLVAPSGYRDDLSRSLKHRRSLRNTRIQASLRLTTSAKGKADYRDLPSLNAGKLRHPVWGRTRRLKSGESQRNPWAVTTIRDGFYTRGTAKAADEAEKQLEAVLDEYQQRVNEG